jgi:PAS domain S-box-containing protein
MSQGPSHFLSDDSQHEPPRASPHEAVETRRTLEERYRHIVETANEGIWVIDDQQRTVYVNGRMAEILGYRPEEMLGRLVWDFLFDGDRAAGRRFWERRTQGVRERIEFPLRRKDGSEVWTHLATSPLYQDDGRFSGALGMVTDITEERQADLAMRESERRLVQLADTMPQIVWTAGPDGSIDYFNARWYEYTGMTAEESLTREGWQTLIHPDDRDVYLERRNQAVRADQCVEAEIRLRNRAGNYRWHLVRTVPVRDESGRTLRRYATATDIDDRKRTEQDTRFLAEASAALAALTDEDSALRQVAQLAVPSFADWCVVDMVGDDDALRRLAVAHADPSKVELALEVGRRYPPSPDASHVLRTGQPELVPEITDAMLGATAQDEEYLRIIRQLGLKSYLCVPLKGRSETLGTISFIAAESGRRFGPNDLRLAEDLAHRAAIAIANARLYEELKEANRRKDELVASLQKSEGWFRTVADSIPQPAWMTRPDGYIIWYNKRWYDYTGTTPEQMEGWGWQSVHDPAELPRVLANWQAALANGEPWEDTFPLRRRDGAMRWHLSRALPVREESGRIMGWFGTNTDITDRMQLEEALLEADRRKNIFLATLAHELRNPLAPIRNALRLLKRATETDPASEAERAMAERQVTHLARLVDDLMDVSRINQGRIELHQETVDLATIVERAVASVGPSLREREHTLTVELPDEPIWLDADPTRLEQVLWNLLNNAIKYTEPGGRIWLTAERDNDKLVLNVRDTGIGIEPAMLSHIFEMFFQAGHPARRSQGGLGIGLSLVKTLIELHGGTIMAESPGVGQGTEFLVRLPALPPSSAPRPPFGLPPGIETISTPKCRRILVVDDNVDAANSLARVLRKLDGHEVAIAHDGPSALAAAEAFRPEIVLLDIGMPGMTGYEVAERLRANPEFAGVLLVALTGWGQESDRHQSRAAGFDHHLVKPVDLEALRELIHGGKPAT